MLGGEAEEVARHVPGPAEPPPRPLPYEHMFATLRRSVRRLLLPRLPSGSGAQKSVARRRDYLAPVASVLLQLRDVAEAPQELVAAIAVAGLPEESSAIASYLGIDEAELAATRGGALQADLDVPAGFWRVWPARGIGLWISRKPGQRPPLGRLRPNVDIDLARTLLRLGERGIWLYEGRLYDREHGWSRPLALLPLYRALTDGSTDTLAVAGAWSDPAGRAYRAVLTRTGELQARYPTQAVRWLAIACDLPDDPQ